MSATTGTPLPPLPVVRYYRRRIASGTGTQTVQTVDGIITAQSIHADSGWFTGPGNPEWIGQPAKSLRGKGFRILPRNSQYAYDYLRDSADTFLAECEAAAYDAAHPQDFDL